MIVYVDLDNTLCTTNGTDYENSKPIVKRIDYINDIMMKVILLLYILLEVQKQK